MAEPDDIPIIRGPLVGTGDAPEVRPPSVIARKRRAHEADSREHNGADPTGNDTETTGSEDDKTFRDKVADKIEEVAEKLAERISSSDDVGARSR